MIFFWPTNERAAGFRFECLSFFLGEFIEAKIDIALGNDITAPLAIEEFKKSGVKQVFDKDKIVLVPDHFAPAKDLRSANQCKILADFAREENLKNYYSFFLSNKFINLSISFLSSLLIKPATF